MDASSSDLATKGRKLQAKAKGKAAPRVGYFKRTSLTCLQQLDVLIEEARRTRYPYAIGWSGEWVKVYLYPQESNGRKEGGKGRREGEGEGGRVDVLALMKATEGVVAVHKASLRILFKVRRFDSSR